MSAGAGRDRGSSWYHRHSIACHLHPTFTLTQAGILDSEGCIRGQGIGLRACLSYV